MGKFDWLRPKPRPRQTILEVHTNVPGMVIVRSIHDYSVYGTDDSNSVRFELNDLTREINVLVTSDGHNEAHKTVIIYPNRTNVVYFELVKSTINSELKYKGRGSQLGLGYGRQTFPYMLIHNDNWDEYASRLSDMEVWHHTTWIDGNTWGLVSDPYEIEWNRMFGIPFIWTSGKWDVSRLNPYWVERTKEWALHLKNHGIINNWVLATRYTGLDKPQDGAEVGPYLLNHQNDHRLNDDRFWNSGPDLAYRILAKGIVDISDELELPLLVTLGNECKGKEFHRNAADYILSLNSHADIMVNRQNDMPGHYDEHLQESRRFHRVEFHGNTFQNEGYISALDYIHPEESSPERLSYSAMISSSRVGWNPILCNISDDGGRAGDFLEDAYEYDKWLELAREMGLRNYTHQSVMKQPSRVNGMVEDLSMMDYESEFMLKMGRILTR